MNKISILLLAFIFFAQLACGKKDPCENTICENEGICNEGICECKDHFSGPTCEEEEKPSKITSKLLFLEKLPATKPDGSGWDSGSAPEIIVTLTRKDTIVWKSQVVFDAETPLRLFNEPNIVFKDPTKEYQLIIEDQDGPITGNDIIYGVNFQPYQNGQSFPEFIVLENQSKTVRLVFEESSYEW